MTPAEPGHELGSVAPDVLPILQLRCTVDRWRSSDVQRMAPPSPNKKVFSDHQNPLYDKSTSLRCDGKLFQSPGPAAAKAVTEAAVGPCNDTCSVLRGA